MKILLAVAVAMSALAAPSAYAAGEPAAKVFYGDLDIGAAAGMATLKNRIAQAARNLCGNGGDADLYSRSARTSCYRAAVFGALQQLPDRAPQFASR